MAIHFRKARAVVIVRRNDIPAENETTLRNLFNET